MPSVVFFGSFLHYSTKVLRALTRTGLVKVLAVVTTPPRHVSTRKRGGPAGRQKLLTKTHTHLWAEKHHLPVFTPEKLSEKVNPLKVSPLRVNLTKPDFFVVAGYGKKLPPSWLKAPKIAPLNLHFSLLPKYRGANPAEWALLCGEKETGVTLIKMEESIDSGPILAQAKLGIKQPTFQGDTFKGGDTRETIYKHLYKLGADILPETLITYQRWHKNGAQSAKAFGSGNGRIGSLPEAVNAPAGEKLSHKLTLYLPPKPQLRASPTPYARLLKRPDSFIPWQLVTMCLSNFHATRLLAPEHSDGGQAMRGNYSPDVSVKNLPSLLREVVNFQNPITKSVTVSHLAILIERAVRALSGFPGIWTAVKTPKGQKSLKVLSAHIETSKSYKLKVYPVPTGTGAKSSLVLDQVQIEGLAPTSFNQIKNQLLP